MIYVTDIFFALCVEKNFYSKYEILSLVCVSALDKVKVFLLNLMQTANHFICGDFSL